MYVVQERDSIGIPGGSYLRRGRPGRHEMLQDRGTLRSRAELLELRTADDHATRRSRCYRHEGMRLGSP